MPRGSTRGPRRSLVLLAIVCLAVAAAAPAVAAQSDAADAQQDDEPVAISGDELDGAVFFGGTLTVENLTPFDDGTVQLRQWNGTDSEFSGDVDIENSSSFTIDTDELAAGSYVLRDANGDVGPFEVVRHEVDVSVAERSDDEGTAALAYEDNRDEPVDLFVSTGQDADQRALGADLDADALADVLGGDEFETTVETDETLRIHDVRAGQSVPIDLDGLGAPTYAFTVAAADTVGWDVAVLSLDRNVVPDRTVGAADLNGTTVWRGESLEVTDLPERGVVRFHGSDGAVRERTTDVEGSLTLETDRWATGEWTVETNASGEVGTFDLEEQTIHTFDFPHAPTNDDRYFRLESNREEYEVAVSSDDLDVETLATALDTGSVEGDRIVIEVDRYNAPIFQFDASHLPVGEYEVRASALDTSAQRTTTLAVESLTDTNLSVDEVDGATVWLGQTLELTGLAAGDDVVFSGPDSAHRERTAGDDGTVIADTTDWTAGEYVVEVNGSDAVGTFDLNEQTVDFEVSDEPVADSTLVYLESNRSGYTIALSSDRVDAETLADNLYSGRVEGDRVLLDSHGRHRGTRLYVSDLPGGEYDFEAEVVDAAAGDTANVTVSAGIEVEGNYPMPYGDSKAYWDVNGDRSLTNTDVVEFFGFQHYHPAVEEHPTYFDFDGDGSVGQGDVVRLFEVVNGAPIETPDSSILPPEFRDPMWGDTEELGDVTTFELDVEHTDELWINVSQPAADYGATVHLTDVDPNETVALDVNTFRLAQGTVDGAFPTAQNAEIAAVRDWGEVDDDVVFDEPTGFYLESYAADPTKYALDDGIEFDLEAPAFYDLETYVAPSDAPIEAAEGSYDLTRDASRRGTVAHGDVVIAAVNAPGITGAVGDDAASLDRYDEGLRFYLRSTRSTPNGTATTVYNVSDPAVADDVTLLSDPENDAFFVAFESEALLSPGEEWEFGFEVSPESPYVEAGAEPITLNSTVAVEEPSVAVVGPRDEQGRLLVENDTDAEITAETNVVASDAEVTVETADDVHTGTASVSSYLETVTGTFDFAGYEPGVELRSIEVALNDSELATTTEGVIVGDADADAS